MITMMTIPRTTVAPIDVQLARMIAKRDMLREAYDRKVEESRRPLPSGRHMTILEKCVFQASAWDAYFAVAQDVGALMRSMRRAA